MITGLQLQSFQTQWSTSTTNFCKAEQTQRTNKGRMDSISAVYQNQIPNYIIILSHPLGQSLCHLSKLPIQL